MFEPPVIGILRGIEASFFSEVMNASFDAGLCAIEITMNTLGAENIIADNISTVPQGKYLGMGTIRNLDEARRAIDAGAMFLVTPNLDTAVIDYAAARNIPVVAGALTPTEIYRAWSAGADMIKVFPCGAMGGPGYIKELLGPFDSLALAAVGGVSISNLEDYFRAGVRAVGVGNSLFGQEALAEKNPEKIKTCVKNFIARCLRAKDEVLSAS